jgi:hypothetical protein
MATAATRPPASTGPTLSGHFASCEDAEQAAQPVRDGAVSARLERRTSVMGPE